MSNFLLKQGYSSNSIVKEISKDEFQIKLASPEILDRLEKFARQVQALAPKSDDFLYFSIIFLKAAEASLIDDYGDLRKIGNDKAWGFFDEEWKWQGNVKPHKNNNGDIFPESELKKASRKWIGLPLCVDHKSDSVDGIRGIILDTHYDEKLKQVVGLCALDRVNYPELARKVSTGVVRFGSMGTAVEISVCSECGNNARTPKEYCNHILSKSAHGEINVGLKPIEYSLVVQPAEPGAKLLRCIASIQSHEKELKSYGINVTAMVKSLDEESADTLDQLLNRVCGPNGCSIEQRKRIITSFVNRNEFVKTAAENADEFADTLAKIRAATGVEVENVSQATHPRAWQLYLKAYQDAGLEMPGSSTPPGEEPPLVDTFTSRQTVESPAKGLGIRQEPADYTGPSGSLFSSESEPTESRKGTGVGPETYIPEPGAFEEYANDNTTKKEINSIMEEIMKESRLRKRAELRRRLAYHQGGSEGVEPSTFKSEDYHKYWMSDKHMHQDKSMGGADGMFPGDEPVKTKQKRAELEREEMRRRAYHQGGSEGVEPATFKTEDYHKYWMSDKHMHQDKSMGGADGMFPGDEPVKSKQKRAAYKGPPLSTKFKQRRRLDGSIDKKASCFEVYAGDQLVIATTAGDIWGPALEQNWDYVTSVDYGKAVVAEIRENGLPAVGSLLTRRAQAAPPAPPAPPAPAGPEAAAPMGEELPPMDEGLPPLDEAPLDEGAPEEEEKEPKAAIEDDLLAMEEKIDEIREQLGRLGGEEVRVDIDVGGVEDEGEEEAVSLAKTVVTDLKIALAEAIDSADELAMIAETYEGIGKLSGKQRSELRKLATEARRDSRELLVESDTLIRMAKVLSDSLVKTSEYVETPEELLAATMPVGDEVFAPEVETEDSLFAEAMNLRKARREQFLKEAEASELKARKVARAQIAKAAMEAGEENGLLHHADGEDEEADHKHDAHDGIGMKENAQVAGVTSDMAEDVAGRDASGGDHGAAPAKGNHDVHQHSSYPSTPASQVAQKSMADDGAMVNNSEDGAGCEKCGCEPCECEKEDDANDGAASTVQAKLTQSFMSKKAAEERETYRLKLRRAYDVAMEQQRKGMIAPTKPALDRQVDLIMEFDDKAFESFKQVVANTKPAQNVKVANDLGGVNIGVGDPAEGAPAVVSTVDALSKMWD